MSDKEAETAFDQWMQYAIRYFVLANSGAAVATLSFMGASGKVPCIGVLAFASFVAGIIVAGLVILGQLIAAWRKLLNPNGALNPEGIERAVAQRSITHWGDRVEKRSGTFLGIAFGLFTLGAVLGIATLLRVSIVTY